MAPIDWRRPETYEKIRDLDAVGFAWEYLRRNPDYRRAYLQSAATRQQHLVMKSLVATSALGAVFSRPIPRFQPASKPYSGHHRLRRLSSSLFPPLLRPPTRLTSSA